MNASLRLQATQLAESKRLKRIEPRVLPGSAILHHAVGGNLLRVSSARRANYAAKRSTIALTANHLNNAAELSPRISRMDETDAAHNPISAGSRR